MDKNWLKKARQQLYSYVFPLVCFCLKLAKIANKRTKKALLIINWQNINYVQLTNYLSVQVIKSTLTQ